MNSGSESYEPMFRESIKHFLSSYRSGNSDFSAFESIFFRLIQTMLDPPLEITWFYSAVTCHSSRSTPDGPPNKRLLLSKDLFQLLVSSSSLSNGSKKIALLAPIVYELYNIAFDSSRNGLCLGWEVEDLVEKIVSYIYMCCCKGHGNGNESDPFVVSFEDLTRIWTIDRVGECCKFQEYCRVFFPIMSEEVMKGIDERCGIASLAGIVLCEVFLLRLCLKFDFRVPKEEFQTNIRYLAVQMIEGFQNFTFIDMLLQMLLEPTLPVTGLLSSEDVVFLRKALYDAVILFDSSFLYSGKWIQLHDNNRRNLALMWSLVADAAVQFTRDISDHGRAVSYVKAFCESQFSNQLIKWISDQAGLEESFRPNISDPTALTRWLFVLENQGLKVFDRDISAYLAKAAISKSKLDVESLGFSKDAKSPKEYILSQPGDPDRSHDKVNRDEEMADPFPKNANPAAMCTSNTLTESRRKRKEGFVEAGETRVKLAKYDLHGSSIHDYKFGSGSEMGNPVTDEDIEVMVTG